MDERRFTLDIKISANTDIDIDCSPDTTNEELELVLRRLRKLDFTKFKFKIVSNRYAEEIANYVLQEVSAFATVIKADFVEDKHFMIAFTVKFGTKQQESKS